MKKIILLVIAVIGFAFAGNAQRISENALGLRLGDSDGFGAEIQKVEYYFNFILLTSLFSIK